LQEVGLLSIYTIPMMKGLKTHGAICSFPKIFFSIFFQTGKTGNREFGVITEISKLLKYKGGSHLTLLEKYTPLQFN